MDVRTFQKVTVTSDSDTNNDCGMQQVYGEDCEQDTTSEKLNLNFSSQRESADSNPQVDVRNREEVAEEEKFQLDNLAQKGAPTYVNFKSEEDYVKHSAQETVQKDKPSVNDGKISRIKSLFSKSSPDLSKKSSVSKTSIRKWFSFNSKQEEGRLEKGDVNLDKTVNINNPVNKIEQQSCSDAASENRNSSSKSERDEEIYRDNNLVDREEKANNSLMLTDTGDEETDKSTSSTYFDSNPCDDDNNSEDTPAEADVKDSTTNNDSTADSSVIPNNGEEGPGETESAKTNSEYWMDSSELDYTPHTSDQQNSWSYPDLDEHIVPVTEESQNAGNIVRSTSSEWQEDNSKAWWKSTNSDINMAQSTNNDILDNQSFRLNSVDEKIVAASGESFECHAEVMPGIFNDRILSNDDHGTSDLVNQKEFTNDPIFR